MMPSKLVQALAFSLLTSCGQPQPARVVASRTGARGSLFVVASNQRLEQCVAAVFRERAESNHWSSFVATQIPPEIPFELALELTSISTGPDLSMQISAIAPCKGPLATRHYRLPVPTTKAVVADWADDMLRTPEVGRYLAAPCQTEHLKSSPWNPVTSSAAACEGLEAIR